MLRALISRRLLGPQPGSPSGLFKVIAAGSSGGAGDAILQMLQKRPTLVKEWHRESGHTALEWALKNGNKEAVRELLKFNAEITEEAKKIAREGDTEMEEILKKTKEGRRKAKKAVLSGHRVKTHVREPELTWTGAGFKVKESGGWQGWIRVNRHRNYIASPSLERVNEMCRRGA
jgi:ankyrin repeat protein